MIRAFVAKRAASSILAAAITGTAIAPAPARAVVYATEQTQLLVLAKEIETVINTVKQLEYSAQDAVRPEHELGR